MEDKTEKDIRELLIEDELGNILGDLSLISFVKSPRIEQDYKFFSKDEYQFSQIEEEKQIVTGCAMRVGFIMQDIDPTTGKIHDIVFNENQVKTCSEIFLVNNRHQMTNIEHGKLMTQNEIDGVYVVESWIVEDPETDKAKALGFSDISKGDWYVSFKIKNKEFWNFIKEYGGGFSIEGRFAEQMAKNFSALPKTEAELIELAKSITFNCDLSDNEKERKLKRLLFPEQD